MEVSAEKLFFFEKDPAMLDVYLSIEAVLLKRYPGIHVKVPKHRSPLRAAMDLPLFRCHSER